MAIRANRAVVRHLGAVFNLGAIGDLSDAQLLEWFTSRDRDTAEHAFAALVERHGPMVLRVCRNLVRDPHDAEDAFQATFLVLVQKAHGITVRDSLAPWLHRVAHRVAARLRASARRRRDLETRAAARMRVFCDDDSDGADLSALIHEEIDRLPERFRIPVVVCDLEGMTHERAAGSLGWPIGTVKSRLMRARELLRRSLSRRGAALPAGALITKVLQDAAEAASSLPQFHAMVQTAVSLAHPEPGSLAAISARAARLSHEVQRTMLMSRLKTASVIVFVAGAVAAGAAGVLAKQGNGPPTNLRGAPASSTTSSSVSGFKVSAAPSPPYIQQSRTMIVTRLEHELRLANERLERTLQKVSAPDDPLVAQREKRSKASRTCCPGSTPCSSRPSRRIPPSSISRVEHPVLRPDRLPSRQPRRNREKPPPVPELPRLTTTTLSVSATGSSGRLECTRRDTSARGSSIRNPSGMRR